MKEFKEIKEILDIEYQKRVSGIPKKDMWTINIWFHLLKMKINKDGDVSDYTLKERMNFYYPYVVSYSYTIDDRHLGLTDIGFLLGDFDKYVNVCLRKEKINKIKYNMGENIPQK